MRERPILFSGAMVRAILEGRKTQTRRVVKPQPKHRLIEAVAGTTIGMDPSQDGGLWYDTDCINPGKKVRCRYGQPGDRAWVKETWNVVPVGRPAPLRGTASIPTSLPEGWDVMYRASGDVTTKQVGWRSPIHMPRWASRITLEITGVRVERLQEITPADAISEGLFCDGQYSTEHPLPYPVATFKELWQSINGPGSWDANPWVWVLEFKRLEATR